MSFGSFVTGSVLGGALVYGSLCWHVLRTDDGYEFVRKTSGDFAETYVDVRNFSMSDWPTSSRRRKSGCSKPRPCNRSRR
jgi:hypothetical protein